MRALVLAFFFVSGLCGLLYEVVWIRVAGTVIGNTTYALGTVVGVFMGGLALGAWAGGRAADRRSGAALLRLYGLLEGGIAISAAAVPFLLAASEPLFRLLWNSVGEITALYAALRVVLMGAVLLVPTTLMGATLPVLTRYLAESAGAAPGEAGRAYAVNTFGGVAGTLAAGLWLIPSFGLRATTALAVSLNLGIAAASLALARGRSGAVEPAPAPEPPPARLALVVAAFSGFAALVCEVAWTRALVLSLGSTVTAFTLILAAFILGLAAGSAAASRLVRRIDRPSLALAGIQSAIGLTAIFLLPYLGGLPVRDSDPVVAVATVVFVPAALMGAVFPFAFRLASGSDRAVGRSVAAVYSWNTVGSIAGSLAASFALIPMAGVATSLRIAATVNLALAALLLAPRLKPAAIVPLAVVWLLPSWDERVLASGAYLYGPDYAAAARALRTDVRDVLKRETTIVASHWDAYGLTTVHRAPDGSLSIRVNGKADASTGAQDMPTQRALGHLPMVHHPAPSRTLVIGLGSGVTLASAAAFPVRQLDCVELSPAGVRAAGHFDAANGGILKDPRVRLVVGDGRNAVQFAKDPFDVIISQPSNLWVSGMANLFSRDFFEMASRRMARGGIFCQWVHAYRMPVDDFRSVLRTFFDVFPHGSVWEVMPGQDYLLLGSPDALRVPYADLDRRVAVVSDLYDGLPQPGAAGLLGRFVAGADGVRRHVASAPILTDDRSSIETRAARAMRSFHQPRTIAWIEELRKDRLDESAYPGMPFGAVEKSRDLRRRIASVVGAESEQRPPHEILELLAREVGSLGEDEPTRPHFEQVAYLARQEAQSLRLSARAADAMRVLAAIPRESRHYPDALFERAQAAILVGKKQEALRLTEELLRDHVDSFPAACILAQNAEEKSRLEEAIGHWRRATVLRPDSDVAFAHLASALHRHGRPEEARQACLRALEIEPRNALARDVLQRLGR